MTITSSHTSATAALSTPTTPGNRANPVRMGVLNLLVMVIALSLAVLSMLALTTAQAGRTLSELEAQSVQSSYVCESAGQEMLSLIDGQLTLLKAQDATPEHILRTMRAAGAGIMGGILQNVDAPGMNVTLQTLTAAEATELLGQRIEQLAPLAVCAIQARFVTADRQALDCLVAINNDYTYKVIAWQKSRVWEDEPREQLLTTIDTAKTNE